jgi:hypothetical protein
MKLKITLLLIICLGFFKGTAQQVIFSKKEYFQGKIMSSDFKKTEAENLVIKGDSVSYLVRGTNKAKTKALADINYLRLQEGTQAGAGALIGGLTALGIVLRETVAVSTSGGAYVFKENATLIYAGLLGGGTALGALIGAAIPKWKTYYLGNQKVGTIHIRPDFQLGSASSVGFKIKCSM